MFRSPWLYLGIVALLTIVGLVVWQTKSARQPVSNTTPTTDQSPPSSPQNPAVSSPTPSSSVYKTVKVSDIADVPNEYDYSVEVPSHWQVEVIKAAEAINFYDPTVNAQSNLEKSQVFIRYFKANSFLTLSTVNIIKREELKIQDRPAIRYVIEKKSGVADFPSQPSWRNLKHVVTDIRLTNTNPSIFYVIAQRPDLDGAIYQHFLDTLDLK